MKRKDLTDSEKLDILQRLAQTPKKSQEVVAEEIHHRKAKVGGVLKKFQEMDWQDAKAFCGNCQHILALRPDCLDRHIAEERGARVKAEEAAAKLESEKAATMARIAEQARVTAMHADEDEFIDPFTGEAMSPWQWLFDLHCQHPC